MSGWTALNVEPEDAVVDEVDDTKEIQLEEAFKLYQNALKLHSQGPQFYDEAREAYDELFRSEVFKYPEATSEFDQEQAEDKVPPSALPVGGDELPLLPGLANDTSANSLPQLVYLAYKSRAQFVIDVAYHQLGQKSMERPELYRYYAKSCLKSLEDSAGALERDDTDLDLWKKAARVSDLLNTQRAVRFCLESVLAGDDDGEQTIDLSGLDEAFAKGELEEVLNLLEDDLARMRTADIRPKSMLLDLLRKSNDPFPFLPQRSKTLNYTNDAKRPLSFRTRQTQLPVSARTYLAIGQALLQAYSNHESGSLDLGIGATIQLQLAGQGEQESLLSKDVEMVVQNDVPPAAVDGSAIVDTTDSPASFHSATEKVLATVETPETNAPNESSPTEEGEKVKDLSKEPEETKAAIQIALPTRKRSSTAAGNEEPEARTKSKRIRARESLAELAAQEEEITQDTALLYRDQIAAIENADDVMFKTVNEMLEKVGVPTLGTLSGLQRLVWPQVEAEQAMDEELEENIDLHIVNDIKNALATWNEERNIAFSSGNGVRDFVEKSTGLSLFLKHSKATMPKEMVPSTADDEEDVMAVVSGINEAQMSIYDAVFELLLHLLTGSPGNEKPSSYAQTTWSEDLKQVVVEILVSANEQIVSTFQQATAFARDTETRDLSYYDTPQLPLEAAAKFAQSMFELHLDIYSEITNPASTVDTDTRKEEMERLQRWANLSTDMIHLKLSGYSDEDRPQPLVLRFIWASATLAKQSEQVDKSHVLLCLQDLHRLLQKTEFDTLSLPNNAAMPQISVNAIEQEISRLNTLDFFMSVFDSDNSDPVAVIMKLEPILEATSVAKEHDDESHFEEEEQVEKFRTFLDAGDASLTLFLWRRLQNAYTAISYNPKVVSCLLKSLEIVTRELTSPRLRELSRDDRYLSTLRWLRDADEMIAKILAKISDDPKAFESIDEPHLQSSISAVVYLLRALHGFALADDALRIGQVPPPSLRSASLQKSFDKCKDRFREMYVRLWTLLFSMLKEATVQMPTGFEHPADDLANYLRCVHNSLGERQYCKYCNKMFVRLTKAELLGIQSDVDYSIDVAQVLYDLYQIKLSSGVGDANHGCPPESLDKDKKTAHSLVPIIMGYVKRLNMRDLLKSELKGTVEKIQNALGQVKSSPALSYNRRTISAYLKSPINPQDIYRSLKGIGEIMTKPVKSDFALIAEQGWYHLLGSMTLAKYKSVKRVNPTPTDDLDIAASFLRQDLEHSTTNWESWYRLAQVFDAKIEDSLIWNSAKLNDSRAEIATLERNSIHAYSMAIATAMRSADEDVETLKKIGDMFGEFAIRLYSSSRPPLNMEAFNAEKAVRHLSSQHDQTMSKAPLFMPMREYALWGLAAYLLRRKLAQKRKEWLCYYTLGKCLWKMFQSKDNVTAKHPVTVDAMIEAFSDAIETVPKKEKSSDPILEPHFKLVSIVHKLQERKFITPMQGVEYLQVTPFAKEARLEDDEQGIPDWEGYILSVLKKLQTADKSNWHHRIIARAAHVIYDTEQGIPGALGAKHQFTQQIFTKTMTMQVWKPEFERPGRHYVYTGRYLKFFVELLEKLADRINLEQVVRRIRRKTTDFIDHTRVWEETVTTYVNLLRRQGQIPDGKERALFDNISFDEFSRQSEKLEQWAHDPETTTSYLDIMQDAIELKKLNNSLMKSPGIDDLIGDTYACMYETFVSQLPPEEKAPPPPAALPQGTFINMTTENAPTGDDNLDRMRLNNLLSAQNDGTSSGPSNPVSAPSGLGIQASGQPLIGTPPPDSIRIPAPAKPGRTKTITRREVQKKAEAAIVKPPPIKTPTLTKRIIVDVPGIKKEASLENFNDEIDQDGPDFSRATSRRGSVSVRESVGPEAGDAEDEGDGDNEGEDGEDGEDSDLSEIEEDEEQKESKPLFPGLLGKKRKAEDDDDATSIDPDMGDKDDSDNSDQEAEIPDSQDQESGRIEEEAEDGQDEENDRA